MKNGQASFLSWRTISVVGLARISHTFRGSRQRNAVAVGFRKDSPKGYEKRGLACYGGKVIATPNLDKLAEEGKKFTQCCAGSPVCAPSRSVLMTGLHAGHTRVRGNFSKTVGVKGLAGVSGRIGLKADDICSVAT